MPGRRRSAALSNNAGNKSQARLARRDSSYKMRRRCATSAPNMAPPQIDALIPFPHFTKVIAVLDVVESVRLMEHDEQGFIQRWHRFVAHARQQVLPRHDGRMHKSLGDGLMLEFGHARGCVGAAFELQQWCREQNNNVPPQQQMHLRVGAHLAEFVADDYDIYGTDVNLTARIATLAGPGEIVVTEGLRDQLTAGLDADIEDLGACWLKHVKEPIRAYRVGPVGHDPVLPPQTEREQDFRPTLVVIPFEARSNEPDHFVIGELVADGVIAQLARSPDLRVISRLSSTAFRGRPSAIGEAEKHLAAGFVLSGSYVTSGERILLSPELASARNGEVIWADRISGPIDDLLQAQSEMLNRLAGAISRALIDEEVLQSLTLPMPRLDSSQLLLGGISMMHRSSVHQFERSRQALLALADRHNRIASPRAWLAKWHIMRIVRGLSESPDQDAQLALEQTRRALDLEPEHALTLAVEGHAYCQLMGDFGAASNSLDRAIAANPNEPLAWLFKSVLTTMSGQTRDDAVTEAEFAAALSPLDPLRYYFDSLLAAAHLFNHAYDDAIRAAHASLRANRHHAPTLRVLVTAQVEAGRIEEARSSLQLLLAESPGLTVSGYLAMGSASSATRQRCAAALRVLGVPER